MGLIINKKFQLIEYLGTTRPISELTSTSNIDYILSINTDGSSFLSWSSSSIFNSLSTITNGSGYLIVSILNNPNYSLYSEVDSGKNTTSKRLTKALEIASFTSSANSSPISSISSISNIDQIFGFSNDGLNPLSWSKNSTMNSLTSLQNGVSYLVQSNSVPYDFWSFLPPSPTPAVTSTPTLTPTVTTSITPTATPANTSTPAVTATPTITPSHTPMPQDAAFGAAFDQQVYNIPIRDNNSNNSYLVSVSINGQANKNYSYLFDSESDTANLIFDNKSGILSLNPNSSNTSYIGKVFSNLSIQAETGQAIVKCTLTDENLNSIDALAIVILDE